jgi:hypothetical protein
MKEKNKIPGKIPIDKLLVAIASTFLFAVSCIISVTPLATGAEQSIYDAYPFYFWFFLICSNACGIAILIHQAYSEEKSHWWFAGLSIIIVSNSVFLGLPSFRGYAFFPKFDAMTHIGIMKDILKTGHIGSDNFYPIVHLLGVSLLKITGLNEAIVANILIILWNIVYLLGLYLLSTIISQTRGQALLITAFACPLIFSYTTALIHPSMLAMVFLPFLFYLFHRIGKSFINRKGFSILLVFLVVALTCAHPVTSLFAITLMFVMNLSALFQRNIFKIRYGITPKHSPAEYDFNIPFLLCLLFWSWYLSYPGIQYGFKVVYDSIVGRGSESLFTINIRASLTSGWSLSQITLLFITRYGAIFIFAVIAAIATVLSLKPIFSKRGLTSGKYNLIYASGFIMAIIDSLFSLLGFTGEFDAVRVSRFFLFVAPIISGLTYYKYLAKKGKPQKTNPASKRNLPIVIIGILIIVSSTISILNIYGSSNTRQQNLQVTKSEIEGSRWLSMNRNENTLVIDTPEGFNRFEDFNFGFSTASYGKAELDPTPLPSAFGYEDKNSLIETLNLAPRYLITSKASRLWGMMLSENPSLRAYDYGGEGFVRLSKDKSVSLIYVNGEFEVWKVQAASR